MGSFFAGLAQFGAIFKNAGRHPVHGSGLHADRADTNGASALLASSAKAGLDCRVSPNIAADVWHKLVINCVVNPITAILGCEVGGIANPQLDPLKQLVIDECLAVAATQGVALAADFLQRSRALPAIPQHRLHASGSSPRPRSPKSIT